jgi:hypothetical protein
MSGLKVLARRAILLLPCGGGLEAPVEEIGDGLRAALPEGR